MTLQDSAGWFFFACLCGFLVWLEVRWAYALVTHDEGCEEWC